MVAQGTAAAGYCAAMDKRLTNTQPGGFSKDDFDFHTGVLVGLSLHCCGAEVMGTQLVTGSCAGETVTSTQYIYEVLQHSVWHGVCLMCCMRVPCGRYCTGTYYMHNYN